MIDDRAERRPAQFAGRAGHLLACFLMWSAAVLAAQALRDVFAFVPGFVPWSGESPRAFLSSVGMAALLAAVAVFTAVNAGFLPAGATAGRFLAGVGLRPPVSIREALRWAAVGATGAVALWLVWELVALLPALHSVPAAEDPRTVAVAQTSAGVRFCYGLVAPAPLEELQYRAPVLALWLVLLTAKGCGGRLGSRWVRWSLTGVVSAASVVLFAAGHTMGGSANVAHAAANAVITTAVTLWQRSLYPALAAHALYDAYAYTVG
ncbi:type II CAAX prenyl endopeptidase Rce1 family protein [Streptomyces sp. NPDC051546]|uniref:CPBP family glutamic-type intramembrane protease n=1 Tax=Streptomyces sp. NPDC051546 TaxID=3365655 RepID=UPI0037AE831D